MSLKQEIETWVAALAAYDNNEFDAALKCFEQICDTSKIYFNIGVINATLGEHARAVDFYSKAVQLDQYLAVAYFQAGVSNFLMGDFEEALANFNDTLLYLRGNNNIDYEQLGLKFKLYSCEVLFNRGLCYIYLQQKDAGMQDLMFAAKEKMVSDHSVIDEAIKEQAEGYTVFSIPVGIVYRPNEAKVKNLKTKDYLGKARLVAAQEYQNRDPRRSAALAAKAIDDRPEDKLSYAALNLVNPNLKSRSRQQSEPPLHRNVFPPTPPPEPEQRDSSNSMKRMSGESTTSTTSALQQGRAKPLRLDLGVAAFDHRAQQQQQQQQPQPQPQPRPAPKRSESERPTMRREFSNSSRRSQDSRSREERVRGYDMPTIQVEEDPIEARTYSVDQPQSLLQQRPRSTATRNQPLPISEEEEEDDEVSDPSDSLPLAFEIIPPKSAHRRKPSSLKPAQELRKIRIKVHAEDMRYVMTTPSVTYDELVVQIKQKFGLQNSFKLKMKDEEGDLITMADGDDLDMAMTICKAAALQEKNDMGKMELWIQ